MLPLAIRQRVDRERQEVGAIVRGPVRVQRLQVAAFEKERQPEAVDRRDVGQPARCRGEQQLGLVLLQRRHHRDVELHAGIGARPLVEHRLERVGDRRQRREVRVVLLRPDAQRHRRVGIADPDRRHQRLRRTPPSVTITASAPLSAAIERARRCAPPRLAGAVRATVIVSTGSDWRSRRGCRPPRAARSGRSRASRIAASARGPARRASSRRSSRR